MCASTSTRGRQLPQSALREQHWRSRISVGVKAIYIFIFFRWMFQLISVQCFVARRACRSPVSDWEETKSLGGLHKKGHRLQICDQPNVLMILLWWEGSSWKKAFLNSGLNWLKLNWKNTMLGFSNRSVTACVCKPSPFFFFWSSKGSWTFAVFWGGGVGQKPHLKAASLCAFAKLYTENHFIIKGKNILRI